MKLFIRLFAIGFAVLIASAEAKTIKYEVSDIHPSQGAVFYPRLDLSNAKSVVLTITKNAPLYEAQLTSLEITFPAAAKLTATNFKLVDGNKYRAVVNGAWIYKEVIVEVDASGPIDVRLPLTVRTYLSERTAFINPPAETPDPSTLLFFINGTLRDITPIRIVDTESILIGGKKVTLSLRDRAQTNIDPMNGVSDGFIIDTLWYGRGTKPVVVPVFVPPPEFDAIEAIDLILSGTTDADRMVSIKYKDRFGYEVTTPPTLLKFYLDQAFGPLPPQ